MRRSASSRFLPWNKTGHDPHQRRLRMANVETETLAETRARTLVPAYLQDPCKLDVKAS